MDRECALWAIYSFILEREREREREKFATAGEGGRLWRPLIGISINIVTPVFHKVDMSRMQGPLSRDRICFSNLGVSEGGWETRLCYGIYIHNLIPKFSNVR